jgi:hypothetical protein
MRNTRQVNFAYMMRVGWQNSHEKWLSLDLSCLPTFLTMPNWVDWLHTNLNYVESALNNEWCIFGVVLDLLWWRRNEFVFNNRRLWLLLLPLKWALWLRRQLMLRLVLIGNMVARIRWQAPNEGWVALNTDGSVVEHWWQVFNCFCSPFEALLSDRSGALGDFYGLKIT